MNRTTWLQDRRRPRKSQILLSRFVLSRSGLKIRDDALRYLGPIFA